MARPPIPLVVLRRAKSVGTAVVELLARSGEFMVLGDASDPSQATRMCRDRRPQCVLLYVEAHAQLELLGAVLAVAPVPVVALVRTASAGVQALAAGAAETLPFDAEAQVVATALRLMAGVTIVGRREAREAPAKAGPAALASAGRQPLVVIGTSTGGPPALAQLLGALAAGFAAPVVVVQHMPDDYHHSFAEWLTTQTRLTVSLAQSGLRVQPGTVYLAPGGSNLAVGQGGFLLARPRSPRGPCPSVDVLFESAAQLEGFSLCGVVMTGMGSDGARGLKAIRDAGGLTLVQDRASSAVFGMPAEALKLGAAELALSPAGLAEQLRWWAAPHGPPGRRTENGRKQTR